MKCECKSLHCRCRTDKCYNANIERKRDQEEFWELPDDFNTPKEVEERKTGI